jgi:uncharacterized protein YkwD
MCVSLFLVLSAGCFTPGAESGAEADSSRSSESARCLANEETDRMADQVLHLVNLVRAESGLPPVIVNPALQQVAGKYACRMIEEDFFDHKDPLGYGPRERAVLENYSFYAVGENLAAGHETPADVMQVWMESPSHRANILDPGWEEAGIAVRLGGRHSIYWVQEFGQPAE